MPTKALADLIDFAYAGGPSLHLAGNMRPLDHAWLPESTEAMMQVACPSRCQSLGRSNRLLEFQLGLSPDLRPLCVSFRMNAANSDGVFRTSSMVGFARLPEFRHFADSDDFTVQSAL